MSVHRTINRKRLRKGDHRCVAKSLLFSSSMETYPRFEALLTCLAEGLSTRVPAGFPMSGEAQDLQIEPERPMLQIIEVVLNPLANRSVASPAADLSPPSNTRLQRMPRHVAGNISPKNLNEVRPLRARSNQAHVSAQHIDELRQLVQPRRPQNSAQTGDPFVL